jgi:hypothetical protein
MQHFLSENISATGKTRNEYLRDCTVTLYILLWVQRACKAIFAPGIILQPDRDKQQCAELH